MNVKSYSSKVVSLIFRRRFEEVKDDIANGRITFYNSPPEWTDKLLNVTALNCTLLQIHEEARWN